MDLQLSIVTNGVDSEDVAVQVEASHTVGELAATLGQYLGRGRVDQFSIERRNGWERLSFDDEVGDISLVSGDRVAVGDAPDDGRRYEKPPVVRLVVTSGPDAGKSFDLGIGCHSVGRSNVAMVTLTDPLVSRQHIVLDIAGPRSVELFTDGEASNVPRLQGEPVEGHVAFRHGDVVQIGATRLRLREPVIVRPRPAGLLGRMPFHRTPYFRRPVPEQEIEALAKVPKKPKARRFQYLAAISPMFMGVGLALMFGSMRFLMFAVFSPVMAVGSWWDHRRTGGREYAEAIEQFDVDIEARRNEIAASLEYERSVRLEANPDIELLARRVDSSHNELWQRDRSAPDFLSLRVGIGRGPSKVEVKENTDGDEPYLERLATVNAKAETLLDVPIAIDLATVSAIGLVGQPDDIDDLAAALLMQACCLHSPEDIVVMAAVSKDRHLVEWMKWLPHVNASSSPLAGPQLATDAEAADLLLREVTKIAEARASSNDSQIDRRWPWLLLAIDRVLEPDAGLISRLLDIAPEAGISVIWLTDSTGRVPRQAQAEVVCRPVHSTDMSEAHFTDPSLPSMSIDIERVSGDVALDIARSMSPMSDATAANAVTAIPRIVPLFAALGVDSMTPEWIAQQWATDRGYSLVAPIGLTDTGPLTLNLVEHGPHGLIGGTSGAGKSELVQSLVVNLAAYNSPERINFLFVDYKGGALSEMFKDIPHTVGAVTNLDALLALRALTSLTAELDRRMELFKGRAPDIKEMIAKFPELAPPSLVIVVDEFAALVRELPEFVDGVVSIAERGRSLGIHLLMSTQRPSGAINENIQQNTNLRIALRMLDSSESNNVIGAPDAAMIPGPLKGRGLARLGPGELIPFQSAWSGAPLLAAEGPPPVTVEAFGEPNGMQPGRRATSANGQAPPDPDRTQLHATVDAIVTAAKELGIERGRAPWKETLPAEIPLQDLLDDPRAVAADTYSGRITIAMIDDPEAQDQYPGQLDLAESGAVAIFGNSGSGKSNLLKTIASAAAYRDSQAGGGGLTMFGLDFASRQLGLLARFPQTSAVASGDDLEAVTRILAIIGGQLEERRVAISHATSRGESAPQFSRIMLLIDGYENFMQVFETAGNPRAMQRWIDLTSQLISEGRQYGIDVAFTVSRRGAVRASLMSNLTNRILLRQADDNGYLDFGLPGKIGKGLELKPGQGFNQDLVSMQFAMVTGAPGAEPAADEQSALIEFAASLNGWVAPELVTYALPTEVPQLEQPEDPNFVRIGLGDRSLRPVDVDLTYNNVMVVGPPRSGKTTVLRTIATRMIATGREVWAVGPAGSSLNELTGVAQSAFGRLGDILPVLEALSAKVEEDPTTPRVLIFDDADQYDDRSLVAGAQPLVDGGVRLFGSASGLRGYSSNPIFAELKNARTMVLVSPEDARSVNELVGVTPDMRPGLPVPPGRSVLVADRVPTVLQASSHEIAAFSSDVVAPATGLTSLPEGHQQAARPEENAQSVGSSDGPVAPGPIAEPAISPTDQAVDSAPVEPASTPAVAPADVVDPAAVDPTSVELVFASGERVPVNGTIVVGRRPEPTRGCEVLRINDRALSSRHLVIGVRDGQVLMIDEDSRNGTYLRRPGADTVRLESKVIAPITPGCEIMIGRQTIQVEARELATTI